MVKVLFRVKMAFNNNLKYVGPPPSSKKTFKNFPSPLPNGSVLILRDIDYFHYGVREATSTFLANTFLLLQKPL